MIRRRRRVKEIAFSFDSFLDVVANVVGIIIRMILVVWVGARAYTTVQFQNAPSHPTESAQVQQETDPLQHELEKHRRELAQAQARLLDQLGHMDRASEQRQLSEQELAGLQVRRKDLESEIATLDPQMAGQRGKLAAISLEELRLREKKLKDEIAELEKQGPQKQALRYRAPVSKPIQTEELIFECQGGRVAFVDIGAFLDDIRRGMRDKSDQLKSRWEVQDVTGAIGAFRLRYTIERERGIGLPVPDAESSFRYGVTAWVVEPMLPTRGDSLEKALAPGSEFRQIVDLLDAQYTTVTFCVYPDSFGLFRQLRDYLYQRDLVVAGRPLPEGAPIAASRNGTLSRGQ